MPTRPFLRLVNGPRPEAIGRECRLQPGERVDLGRESHAFGPGGLAEPRISRVHCRVVRLSHGLIVEDLGSRNGTLVQGYPVRRTELEPGDLISLGHTLLQVCEEPIGETPPPPPPEDLVTVSAAMWPARRALRDPVHQHGPTALIGPEGSGRIAFARAQHRLLGRPGQLEILLLAGLSDDRVHHALHGDGTSPDDAALARADGGTLVLPGIDVASPAALQELLHFLRLRHQEPAVGTARPVDVHVVVTSTRDLGAACQAGDLPLELWRMLAPRAVVLPALADRPEDILPLARHLGQRHAGTAVHLGPALATTLARYRWPGGIDELDAVMARIVREQAPSTTLAMPDWGERSLSPEQTDPESTFDPGGLYTAEKP